MAISSKIFEAVTLAIKMNDHIIHFADDVKTLAKKVRDIDRRLIRLETFVEIAEKQRSTTKRFPK